MAQGTEGALSSGRNRSLEPEGARVVVNVWLGPGGFAQRVTRGMPSPAAPMISRWISLTPPPNVPTMAPR